MFYRKIENTLNNYYDDNDAKILCITGARQIGKTYIIRKTAKKKYDNYIEINLADDYNGNQLFKNVKTVDQFYLQVSIIAGNKLDTFNNTIIFLDEIQIYPHLFTLLKSLKTDNKYKYICSGSLLGVTLKNTILIPIGSIHEQMMYPMDFEEFLYANGIGKLVIENLKKAFLDKTEIEESFHNKMLELFKLYLIVGGLPDAVKQYVQTKNIYNVRTVHDEIYKYYSEDASKYDQDNRLNIKKVYNYISSNIENKVKRIQYKAIENINDSRYSKYQNEFEYLVSSGIALECNAISEPKFPLIQSSKKNLLKLYFNDVGLYSNILYKTNVNAILLDKSGVNLGTVYETVVAQELKAHNNSLYYFDKKKEGEIDFLIDDYSLLCPLPIEIKSGRDSYEMRALPKIINNNNYHISKGYVFSNKKEIFEKNKIIYYPIYLIMFI